MAGLDANGLTIRTQAEVQEFLETSLQAQLPGLNIRAGVVQSLIGVLSEELASAWETLQAVHSAAGPDASGILLDQVAALTGTTRRAATKSRVTVTLNLDAGTTVPAGSQAAVNGSPDSIFVTISDAINSTGSAANRTITADALNTGPVAAPAGTLTEIVTPVSGWNTITNAADAQLGRLRATDAELRLDRLIQLASVGSGTVAALRAAIQAITGVIEVNLVENTGESTNSDGLPPKSFEAVVWDGDPSTADDDEIAQAIWDSKAAGIVPYGVAESGTAVDDTGTNQVMAFTRPSVINPLIVAEVTLEDGTPSGWEDEAKSLLVAASQSFKVGQTVYAFDLGCVLQDAPGIESIVTLTLGGGTSVSAGTRSIVQLETADITLTEFEP